MTWNSYAGITQTNIFLEMSVAVSTRNSWLNNSNALRRAAQLALWSGCSKSSMCLHITDECIYKSNYQIIELYRRSAQSIFFQPRKVSIKCILSIYLCPSAALLLPGDFTLKISQLFVWIWMDAKYIYTTYIDMALCCAHIIQTYTM